MAAKKMGVFITGKMNSCFFVSGHIDMKFGQNMLIDVLN